VSRPGPASLVRFTLLLLMAVVSVTTASHAPLVLPDLVLPVVVASALLAGPSRGAMVGLGGGWLVDLLPPGSSVLGSAALMYAAAGLLAGAGRREGQQPFGWVTLVGAASAAVATLGRLVVAALSGGSLDPRAAAVGWVLSAVWCALLVPPLVTLERRFSARRMR